MKFKSYAYRIFSSSGVRYSGALVSFLHVFAVTKFLTVDDAGLYFWIIGSSSIIAALAKFGIDKVLVKIGAQTQQNMSENDTFKSLHLTIFLPILVAAFLFSAATATVLPWSTREDIYSFRLFFFHLVFIGLCVSVALISAASQVYIGRGKIYFGSIITSLLPHSVSLALFLLLSAISPATFETAYLTTALAWAITFSFLAFQVFRTARADKNPDQINLSIVKIPLKERLQFGIIGFSNIADQWLPTFLAGLIASTTESAALALSSRILSVVQLFLAASVSAISKDIALVNDVKLKRVLREFQFQVVGFGLPITFTLYIFTPEVLSFFGHQYFHAVDGLRILIAAQAFNLLLGIYGASLILRSKPNYAASSMVIAYLAAGTILYFRDDPSSFLSLALFSASATIVQCILFAAFFFITRDTYKT